MDMGGSAGVLCAFKSLVENSATAGGSGDRPIHALLCLAENSVSADATRPDDIHVFYSGRYQCTLRVLSLCIHVLMLFEYMYVIIRN